MKERDMEERGPRMGEKKQKKQVHREFMSPALFLFELL